MRQRSDTIAVTAVECVVSQSTLHLLAADARRGIRVLEYVAKPQDTRPRMAALDLVQQFPPLSGPVIQFVRSIDARHKKFGALALTAWGGLYSLCH